MANMAIVQTLKIPPKKRFPLQKRAEELLTAGYDVDAATAIMVAEKLIDERRAHKVVEWVKLTGWSQFYKPRVKKQG